MLLELYVPFETIQILLKPFQLTINLIALVVFVVLRFGIF